MGQHLERGEGRSPMCIWEKRLLGIRKGKQRTEAEAAGA